MQGDPLGAHIVRLFLQSQSMLVVVEGLLELPPEYDPCQKDNLVKFKKK